MKGEVIYIVKKTDSTNDWYVKCIERYSEKLNASCRWKGRVGQRMGNFPAN